MGIISKILMCELFRQVVDDGKLPRSICYTCNEAVTEVSKFFDILTTGQKRLRELLKEQVGNASTICLISQENSNV